MSNIPQPKFREIVFLILYSYDLGTTTQEDIIPFVMKELKIAKSIARQASARAFEVMEKLSTLDDLIGKTSTSYNFNRIHSVERNILRLATFEILFDEKIPPKVAISEAVRLSKKFSSPESTTFINALLDAIYKKNIGESIDTKSLDDSGKNLTISEQIAEEAALSQPIGADNESSDNADDSEDSTIVTYKKDSSANE